MRLLAAFLLGATALAAQAQAPAATLTGTVRDAATGDPLVGANVWLVGTSRGAATDRDGAYRIADVPPGRYPLRVSYVGVTPFHVADLVLTAGGVHRLDASLVPYADVCGSPPWDDRAPVVSRGVYAPRVVTGDEIQRLPVGR